MHKSNLSTSNLSQSLRAMQTLVANDEWFSFHYPVFRQVYGPDRFGAIFYSLILATITDKNERADMLVLLDRAVHDVVATTKSGLEAPEICVRVIDRAVSILETAN